MSLTLSFVPWRSFRAEKKPQEITRWLQGIGRAAEATFKGGMGSSPPSSPGEYPAVRTGRLRGSVRSEVTANSVTIGSNMPYSAFLREGTSKMARRKMSDNALKESVGQVKLGRFVQWTH